MVEDEDRFAEDEVTALLAAASGFLYGLPVTTDQKKKVTRLWYMHMHQFSSEIMETDYGRCEDGFERCSDGACMPVGGC
ncbi:MAG: hypothetical protein ABI882_11520 [Acidobacteriota bacterium]